MTSDGSATIHRAASALPAAGVSVSGRAPAKTLAGTAAGTGPSASTPWKSTYESMSRLTSVCQSAVVVIMPTSAWGAALRISTSCVFRRNTASSTLAPPSATRTATRCGAAGSDSAGGAPPCGRITPGRPPASAMACRAADTEVGPALPLSTRIPMPFRGSPMSSDCPGAATRTIHAAQGAGSVPCAHKRPGSEDPGPTESECVYLQLCARGLQLWAWASSDPGLQGRTTPPTGARPR